MDHPIYRVISFKIIGPYVLEVEFDDGIVQSIDFRPVLVGKLYGPLQDEEMFNQVEIDPEVRTLVWPNGADFDPATLHDWSRYVGGMKRLAKRWATTGLEVAGQEPVRSVPNSSVRCLLK